MKASRNNWIDVVRAASALAVVLFHFSVVPVPRPPGPAGGAWREFWLHGHLGVGVFFFLTGYCVIPGWNQSADAGSFLRRRLGRILPPYWCSLLLIAVMAVAVRLVTGVNDVAPLPRTPGAIMATLSLATYPVTKAPAMNWVYWTLSCVVVFYVLAGSILLAGPKARRGCLVALHASLCLADACWQPLPAGPLFFVKFWPVLGLGAALAMCATDRRHGGWMLAISLLHAAWTIGRGADDAHYLAVACLMVPCMLLLERLPFRAFFRPLAQVGQFSYSIYLVHVPVGIYGFMRVLPKAPANDAMFIGGQILLLAAVLAAALGFSRVAERPFLPPAAATS